MEINAQDLEELRIARSLLENPSLAARISNLIGAPIEHALLLLPSQWSETVAIATRKALRAGLMAAVATVDDAAPGPPNNFAHKLCVAASGAGGGALGILGLPLELPVSTIVMLRSVADIARSHGEDLRRPEALLACLEVFALGGGTSADASEAGYFAVRSTLARAVADAAEYVARRGVLEEAAPALVRLIARIAARFGVPVSQKLAAQMVPVIGAATGASINLLFIDHYQDIARAHFTVRKLERSYGASSVRSAYERL
jgi:hypothetical protein